MQSSGPLGLEMGNTVLSHATLSEIAKLLGSLMLKVKTKQVMFDHNPQSNVWQKTNTAYQHSTSYHTVKHRDG